MIDPKRWLFHFPGGLNHQKEILEGSNKLYCFSGGLLFTDLLFNSPTFDRTDWWKYPIDLFFLYTELHKCI